jgi:hypothetical protein
MASLHPAATIARIDGPWPSLLPSCSKTGGEIERLGAGAYRGSRCRLRHSISAVGPKIPYTKKRSLGPVLSPADKLHRQRMPGNQRPLSREQHDGLLANN